MLIGLTSKAKYTTALTSSSLLAFVRMLEGTSDAWDEVAVLKKSHVCPGAGAFVLKHSKLHTVSVVTSLFCIPHNGQTCPEGDDATCSEAKFSSCLWVIVTTGPSLGKRNGKELQAAQVGPCLPLPEVPNHTQFALVDAKLGQGAGQTQAETKLR